MILIGKPRQDWTHRRFTVGIPLCVTFAAAVGVFFFARNWEDDRSKLEFERWASSFIEVIEDRVTEDHVDLLRAVEGLVRSPDSLDREVFGTFARHLLGSHPEVLALSWNPAIRDSHRSAYEAEVLGGMQTFRIVERDSDGQVVTAPKRDAYVFVHYIEPIEENEGALGFNVSSNIKRKAALDRARDSGLPTATGRISLIQESDNSGGFLVFLPVYETGQRTTTVDERRQYLRGYATGAFRILDEAAEPGEQLIYSHLFEAKLDASMPTNDLVAGNLPPCQRHWMSWGDPGRSSLSRRQGMFPGSRPGISGLFWQADFWSRVC